MFGAWEVNVRVRKKCKKIRKSRSVASFCPKKPKGTKPSHERKYSLALDSSPGPRQTLNLRIQRNQCLHLLHSNIILLYPKLASLCDMLWCSTKSSSFATPPISIPDQHWKNRNKLHNYQLHIFWLRKTRKHFKFLKLSLSGLAISFARTRGIWFSQNSTALWLQRKTSGSHKGIPEKSVRQKRDKPLSEKSDISFWHGATVIMIAIKAIESWNE